MAWLISDALMSSLSSQVRGGGILGGHLLGWRTVCAVEWEQYPASVLCARQNDGLLPPFPIWDDVQTFDGKPWRGIVDVVSGGFPCQDISAAGKGAGIEGERSSMWSHMARIISEARPNFVFVENSPMLTTRGLGTVLADLSKMGFDAEWGVIGAKSIGAPHSRERIWILATNSAQVRRVNPTNEKQSLPFEKVKIWRKSEFDALLVADKQEYEIESEDQRMGDGMADGMDRFAAIGNGQVPVVAATAFNELMERISK